MFGYLAADPQRLTEEQLKRYRACYCGLCRCLKERYGQLYRLTLNYDMAFLALLLSSLYEPEERGGEDVCLIHPGKPREWFITEATGYAADMGVALSWLKLRDNWEDDGSLTALAGSGIIKSAYERVKAAYPRQCSAIAASLDRLGALEKERAEDPDRAAGCFGQLTAELMVLREDRWSGTLRAMGRALGGFIYVMDACMDLDRDAVWGRYNPFRRYYGLQDNESRFRDILKMLLGDCLAHFDRLPLVQDADILLNVLCSGVWTQFDRKYVKKKEAAENAGPV